MKATSALPLLLAYALRPRYGLRGSPGLMDETRYPETVALVREVARAVGSPVPTRLEIGTDFNAHARRAGFNGRTLNVGAPLWCALTPSARVALLGHELGHLAHQDVRSGRFVASGTQALAYWDSILDMDGDASLTEQLTKVLVWPLRVVIAGWLLLIGRVNAASCRVMETNADLAAITAAGTDGAVDLFETLMAATGAHVAINRAAITRTDLHAALDSWRETLTAERRRSARRAGAVERTSADDHHPATIDRLAMAESRQRTSAAVVIDKARLDRLDQEWRDEIDASLEVLSSEFLAH